MKNGTYVDAKILKLITDSENVDFCKEAIKCLEQDGVIALPTDTVYGLATFSKNTSAISRIYKMKGRQFYKPCAICVADIPDIERLAELPAMSLSLLNDLLPGPVTILLKPKSELNRYLSLNNELVGIRIPDNNFIRSICRLSNQSLALTSANISSHESALTIQEFQSLWPDIDLILNGGRITMEENMRLGSTVINLSSTGFYQIVRPGCAFNETTNILSSHGWIINDKLFTEN